MQFAGDRTDADSTSRILNRRKGITVHSIVGQIQHTRSGIERPDAWITTKTKLAMLTTEGVSGTQPDGVVTLFGIVSSQQAKAAAEADPRKMSGSV
jgi:osmotically-inducible protein OsmY